MNFFRSKVGSTARLIQYACAYFSMYALFGTGVKYFQGSAAKGFPGLSEIQFLVYSTVSSSFLCLAVILFAKWWKFKWKRSEILFMILSGLCTALVIPTTTLMYSLPISVMVAMVIMRGSVIVITRIMDSIMIFQGISHKQVRWQENIAMFISLFAVGFNLLSAKGSDFDFIHSSVAMGILTTYILAYALRIYIMNYFKFTRTEKTTSNNQNFFAIEQFTASLTIYTFLLIAFSFPQIFQNENFVSILQSFRESITHPHSRWLGAMIIGLPFGVAAFFSVFLFMFEGRTSTFSGLVNRLSSLLAGTFSTLLFAFFFAGSWPKQNDWISFALILLAVFFLAQAEKAKRKK